MTLEDPCSGADITLTSSPFDPIYQYTLNDLQYPEDYSPSSMATTNVTTNCGTPTVEITMDDGAPLVAGLFSVDVNAPEPFQLKIGFLDDTQISFAGTYFLKYKFYYSNAPGNFEIGPTFQRDIVDACDPHNGSTAPQIIPSTLAAQSYIITDPAQDYQIDPFTTVPAYCQSRLVYSFDINTDTAPVASGTQGDAITFDNDPSIRTYTFEYEGDTDLAGNTIAGNDYTVTVNAAIDTNPALATSDDYVLTIKNPCLDTNYFDINTPASLPDFYYTLYNDTDNTWTHPPFGLTGTPEILALCGGLDYSSDASGTRRLQVN